MADGDEFHSSDEGQNGTAYQGFQTYSPIVDGDRVSSAINFLVYRIR